MKSNIKKISGYDSKVWTYTGGWGGAHFQGSSKSELLEPVEVNLIFLKFPAKMKKYIFDIFLGLKILLCLRKPKMESNYRIYFSRITN